MDLPHLLSHRTAPGSLRAPRRRGVPSTPSILEYLGRTGGLKAREDLDAELRAAAKVEYGVLPQAPAQAPRDEDE